MLFIFKLHLRENLPKVHYITNNILQSTGCSTVVNNNYNKNTYYLLSLTFIKLTFDLACLIFAPKRGSRLPTH